MKKALLILIGLVVVGVAGLAIFVATLDADRYRPLLVSRLEHALGRPVRLGHLRLAWHGGVAVTLQQLAIGQEPLFQADAVHAVVAWRPLLKKRVEIDGVRIDGGRLSWRDRLVQEISAGASGSQDRLEGKRVRAKFAG